MRLLLQAFERRVRGGRVRQREESRGVADVEEPRRNDTPQHAARIGTTLAEKKRAVVVCSAVRQDVVSRGSHGRNRRARRVRDPFGIGLEAKLIRLYGV